MYGMDANPLAHKFHLEALEHEAMALHEPKEQAAPEKSRDRRWSWAELRRVVPLMVVAGRKARAIEA